MRSEVTVGSRATVYTTDMCRAAASTHRLRISIPIALASCETGLGRKLLKFDSLLWTPTWEAAQSWLRIHLIGFERLVTSLLVEAWSFVWDTFAGLSVQSTVAG